MTYRIKHDPASCGCDNCGEKMYGKPRHQFSEPDTEHYGGPAFERCQVCGIRRCEHP